MQRLLTKYYVTVLCALCATGTLDAAPELPMPAEAQEQEDSVHVSLVTFYPGSEPHNIWGHSEIRVKQGLLTYTSTTACLIFRRRRSCGASCWARPITSVRQCHDPTLPSAWRNDAWWSRNLTCPKTEPLP